MPKGACDGDDGWGLRGSISTEFFEELRDGLAAAGIAEIGCDFVEGDEDKGALGEARMGDFEAGFAEDEIAVEENVEIEGARAIGNTGGAVAAEVAFDEENGAKQFERRQSGFESDNGVEEAGLISEADGRGGVDRGAGRDAAEGGEAHGRCGERDFRRAGGAGQVGAKGDVGERHAE